jgi:hypothetical protein
MSSVKQDVKVDSKASPAALAVAALALASARSSMRNSCAQRPPHTLSQTECSQSYHNPITISAIVNGL